MTLFYRSVTLVLAVTLFNCENAFSQTTAIASKEIAVVNLYAKLMSFFKADYDSIDLYSAKFETSFTQLIQNDPATLNYPFKRLVDSNFCAVRTSSDGNFRVYSWDTWTGGSMHFFKTIYQWKSNGKVFTKIPKQEALDAGSSCSRIFTVNIDNKPYYFAVNNGIFSNKDAMESISAFSIEANQLVDTVKLFKTKTKKLNSISVEYDYLSVIDRTERPLELITYDDKLKIIYIPVVGAKGKVTKKNILYQLKDHYFEFIGFETGMRK